jgi:hypothetical protein
VGVSSCVLDGSTTPFPGGGHLPREDEGLPVHDRRILWVGVLGLRVGAAMATGGDAGHGLGRRRCEGK